MSNKINKLQEQLNKIKSELNEAKRREEKRRKILIGSAIQKSVDDGLLKQDALQRILNKYITGKSDREFLELPLLPENPSNNSKTPEYTPQNDNHHQPQPEYQHH